MAAAIRLKRASTSDSTTAFNGQAPRAGPQAKRCKVALVAGSGPHLTTEISCLLRRRLRVAVLIALAGFTVFLVRNLIDQREVLMGSWYQLYQSAVIVLLAGASVLLWSRRPLSMFALRAIELTLFGAMALFFAYLQYVLMHGGVDWRAIEPHEEVMTLAGAANTLRWVILIVLYGTFIPNTCRRIALVVGCLAALPFITNVLACWQCPIMGPRLSFMLSDMLIILSVASAIAIFGSYKISELHQEAFEARKLGQYLLHKQLGAGGMGEVYLGEHLLLRRACAIKLIRADHAGDPTTLERF